MLDFRRRNYGPRAVLADFASNPITVLNPKFCRRTVLVAATWHGAFVWHHPGGIKPLMDGLILRWMVMLLRYGRAGGENEAAPGHTGNRARNTGGAIPASHGGPAKTARNPIPRNLTLCERRATPKPNGRPARQYAKSVVGQSRHFSRRPTASGLPWKRTSLGPVAMSQRCPQPGSCTGINRSLFDHLVGAREQRRRHGEAEGFRGLEVDHHLRLGQLLHWHAFVLFPSRMRAA